MANAGVFPIPGEFKSEDRWFRYFNRKQAVVLIICGILDYRVILWAGAGGRLVPALIGLSLMTLVAMGIVTVKLPVDALFLFGGGLTVDVLLFRTLYRAGHREICAKNYDSHMDREL